MSITRYLIAIAIVVTLLSHATTVIALQFQEVDKTCPLCKTEFKARLAVSGTEMGMRLDLKSLGPIASPWTVAVCPKCHFVLIGAKLKDTELAKLKQYVQTEGYQTWGKTRSSHFLMAKLLTILGRDDLILAHVYLKASWQEENNENYLTEDLKLSLYYFEAYLKTGSPTSNKQEAEGYKEEDTVADYWTAQLVKGELFRRLKQFDAAKAHLQKLQQQEPFQGTDLGKIVKYEIRLCDAKDAMSHDMSDAEENHESPDTDKTDSNK